MTADENSCLLQAGVYSVLVANHPRPPTYTPPIIYSKELIVEVMEGSGRGLIEGTAYTGISLVVRRGGGTRHAMCV
jgi:hypothetical protein